MAEPEFEYTFLNFMMLLIHLHTLDNESVDADKIRDLMDPYWPKLTKEQVEASARISQLLNEENKK